MIKSDRLDDEDWITFIFLICWDGINLLLSIMHVLCSFVIGKSNIGTDNDIGEDFDGDSCWVGRQAKDLFIGKCSVLNTGDNEDFS